MSWQPMILLLQGVTEKLLTATTLAGKLLLCGLLALYFGVCYFLFKSRD